MMSARVGASAVAVSAMVVILPSSARMLPRLLGYQFVVLATRDRR